MKNRWKCRVMVMCLMFVMMLAGCGRDGKVIFTGAFGEDELFRISEVSCSLSEYMVYLTNMQNKYESAFGTQIWEVTFENTTLEENIKDIALANIAQIKSVYLLAKEKDVELTPEEESLAERAAAEYFASLSEAEKKALDVSEEVIAQMYKEYATAQKVYELIVAEVNPEISDDEARTVTVEQIYMRTYTKDVGGNRIEYSQSTKEQRLEDMQELYEMLISGEGDFTELAGKYSEAEDVRYSFKKGEALAEIEEVAFNMQTDEISQVIVCAEGYYILKCISTLDRAQTDANKQAIVEKMKQEAFAKEYDAFVNTLARKLNEKLWDKVELIHDAGVKTSNFFEIYEKYF